MKSVLRTFLTTLVLAFTLQSVVFSTHAIKHGIEHTESSSHHSQDQKIDSHCNLCVAMHTGTYSLNSSVSLLTHSLVFERLAFSVFDSVVIQKFSTVRARAPPEALI